MRLAYLRRYREEVVFGCKRYLLTHLGRFWALRIGSDVCARHTCHCDRLMEAKGIHSLSYKYSAGRHPRHAALNDVRRALKSAGIPSIMEPVGIDRGV